MPVRVVNPLTPEREILRPTLLVGLLEALRDNLRLGEERGAFFELDVCSVTRRAGLPIERRLLALAMAGDRSSLSWATDRRPFDVFDLKGMVETLLARLGVVGWSLEARPHPLLHPGRAASIEVDGASLGFFGELHPRVSERFDLGVQTRLHRRDRLRRPGQGSLGGSEPSRITRASPWRSATLPWSSARRSPPEPVLDEIRRSAKGMLAGLALFDVYEGDPLPPGKKSLAVALEFQSGDRTLTDDEVEKAMYRVRRTLENRVGAEFRA